MSAACSSIAVDIAFLALIWVTNSWKRPVIEGTGRRYRFEGVLTIGGMLGGVGLASPGRIELPA